MHSLDFYVFNYSHIQVTVEFIQFVVSSSSVLVAHMDCSKDLAESNLLEYAKSFLIVVRLCLCFCFLYVVLGSKL